MNLDRALLHLARTQVQVDNVPVLATTGGKIRVAGAFLGSDMQITATAPFMRLTRLGGTADLLNLSPVFEADVLCRSFDLGLATIQAWDSLIMRTRRFDYAGQPVILDHVATATYIQPVEYPDSAVDRFIIAHRITVRRKESS